MLGKPSIISLTPTHLVNLIMLGHSLLSCKVIIFKDKSGGLVNALILSVRAAGIEPRDRYACLCSDFAGLKHVYHSLCRELPQHDDNDDNDDDDNGAILVTMDLH